MTQLKINMETDHLKFLFSGLHGDRLSGGTLNTVVFLQSVV
jgi:hypothetical protein